MTEVQRWAGMLCMLVLIAALIQYVLPTGVMERSMRLVLGGFVILGMLMPIKALTGCTEWEIPLEKVEIENEFYLEQANAQILNLAQENIERLIAESLQKLGITANRITVQMDIDSDNCIVIEKAAIGLAMTDASRITEVQEYMQSYLGIQAEVLINGG